ncbi:hypothetical protein E5A73_15565 [Sphingomonas gei]|uniref:Uncharacterized protein n=1 Tax=Sphingomonas gei TaxID=1395960 RepID=A0A4S1X873_9SPHN|nr:hypothetical protein [Sphingomonas gei]TGX52218.1 hypothetical protein E5A73_15565 [Sphingomonas gei]
MRPKLLTAVLLATALSMPANAADESSDPSAVKLEDAIECRLAASTYNGFALALNGEERIASKRHWVPADSRNTLMNEYDLPTAITVAGHYSTRRIAFTANGVLAVLDLSDPTTIAREQKIENSVDASPLIEAMTASGRATRAEIEAATKSRKFLGAKVLTDRTELPEAGGVFGTHTIISRNISNVSTHPGKTFYGCSYRIDVIGKDGKPL